jgi:poly-gamma-glutamate capsule biosynthesis protein CapA/YwtB (metallophosphatase superfamily)
LVEFGMPEEMIGQVRNAPQSKDAICVVLTGDLVLDVPDPDHWLSGIAPALLPADVVIGHLEVPHTRRGVELAGDVPAPGADPAHLAALARAGFHAVTLAGNHIADCGLEGIEDTVAELERLGIAHAGAGRDLEAARCPALLERRGRRIVVLSYNCVGPEAGWASASRAGCAYLRIDTADGAPVTPNAALLKPSAESLEMLRADIAGVRSETGLVIVALHMGIVHTPARLAAYERPIAQAAIDAGADVVVGHHAHLVRGVEFHRGRPIYHGLGNGCVVTHALSPGQDHPARAAWVERRKALFGFEPDPAYTLAPFHPEAVNAMLGRLLWHADGRLEAGVLPVFVEAPGRPVLAQGERAIRVRDYLAQITRAAALPALRITPRADMTVLQ